MNPKVRELQRKLDNAISQNKTIMTRLSCLEELRAEQDKEEVLLTKLKQEKKI